MMYKTRPGVLTLAAIALTTLGYEAKHPGKIQTKAETIIAQMQATSANIMDHATPEERALHAKIDPYFDQVTPKLRHNLIAFNDGDIDSAECADNNYLTFMDWTKSVPDSVGKDIELSYSPDERAVYATDITSGTQVARHYNGWFTP